MLLQATQPPLLMNWLQIPADSWVPSSSQTSSLSEAHPDQVFWAQPCALGPGAHISARCVVSASHEAGQVHAVIGSPLRAGVWDPESCPGRCQGTRQR